MTLAERAFEIFDRQGERPMLLFLIEHRNPDTDPDMPGMWGAFPLADGGGVEVLAAGVYTDEQSQETRPRTLDIRGFPPHPMRRRPMADWPNSDTIRARAVEHIAGQALDLLREERRENGLDPGDIGRPEPDEMESLLAAGETLEAAPALEREIRRVIEEGMPMPDEFLELLDAHQSHCAQAAAASLPEEQREALLQAALAKLRALQEE